MRERQRSRLYLSERDLFTSRSLYRHRTRALGDRFPEPPNKSAQAREGTLNSPFASSRQEGDVLDRRSGNPYPDRETVTCCASVPDLVVSDGEHAEGRI